MLGQGAVIPRDRELLAGLDLINNFIITVGSCIAIILRLPLWNTVY